MSVAPTWDRWEVRDPAAGERRLDPAIPLSTTTITRHPKFRPPPR